MSTQVHRFHDNVAVYIGTGETVYLSPHQARELGQALIDTANDCDDCKFTDSKIGTFDGRSLARIAKNIRKCA